MHFELFAPWSEILCCPGCITHCCSRSCGIQKQGEHAVCLQKGAEIALAPAGLAEKSLRHCRFLKTGKGGGGETSMSKEKEK